MIRKAAHTAEAFVVLHELHEAARAVVGRIEADEESDQSHAAAAIWPAVIKFVGKGLASLATANLASRLALWNHVGDEAYFQEDQAHGNTHVGHADTMPVGDVVGVGTAHAPRECLAAASQAMSTGAAWADDKIRFYDSLAAVLKLMVHLKAQAYAEHM